MKNTPRTARQSILRWPLVLTILAVDLGVGAGCRSLRYYRNWDESVQADDPSLVIEGASLPQTVTNSTPRNGETAVDTPATPSAPRLTPGVRVNVAVTVVGKREISEVGLSVSDAGELQLPLLNDVPVRDMTLLDVETRLVTLYSRFFRDPQVVVTFTQVGSDVGVSPWGYATVMGRVMKPGRIAFSADRNLTLSAAIAQAGGLATSARDRAVQISRKASDGTVITRTVNLRAIVASGKMEEDIALQPDDIIFVPEGLF